MRRYTLDIGNALELLRTYPSESVQTVVTSPPYWGLRDYKIQPQIWGGDAECRHRWAQRRYYTQRGTGVKSDDVFFRAGKANAKRLKTARWRQDDTCRKCGAWRGSFGLEPTPEMYIDHAVEIFRELRRVLRADGTLWLNMGDCYANDGKWGGETGGKQAYLDANNRKRVGREKRVTGLKPKDLVGMPWTLALALRADGWWLRQDIIWDKDNPMPESVQDRCTKSHEYIFLLAKSERYFYDAEAIKEPSSIFTHSRGNGVNPKARREGQHSRMREDQDPRHVEYERNRNNGVGWGYTDDQPKPRSKQNESFSAAVNDVVAERNKRSVWEIATEAFSAQFCLHCRAFYPDGVKANAKCRKCGKRKWLSHFATFPTALVEPCVLAGTSEKGCCGKCGAPWVRIIEGASPKKVPSGWNPGGDRRDKVGRYDNRSYNGKNAVHNEVSGRHYKRILQRMVEGREAGLPHDNPIAPKKTIGWEPTCKCKAGVRPCVVLDPFSGAGTTGVVTLRLGREYRAIEINPDYAEMQSRRLEDDAPLFNQAADLTLPPPAQLMIPEMAGVQ